MRIAINLLYLLPSIVGGTETYARALVKTLAETAPELQLVLFLNSSARFENFSSSRNVTPVVLPVSGHSRELRYLVEQLILPVELRARKVALVHSLGYVGPLFTHCPSVLTIPDLNFIQLRGIIPERKRKALQWFSTTAAKRADHVITISEFSKKQIEEKLGIAPEKVTTTLLGPGWEIPAPASFQEIRKKYSLPEKYVAVFGGTSPHKNIETFLQAFQITAARVPHSLVLMGRVPPGLDAKAIMSASGLASRLILTGYLDSSEIEPMLRGAEAFVLPSTYEGFGLPVLEAQRAGTAVVCSDAASLPEIGGAGALYFDPNDVRGMADRMLLVLQDPSLREDLVGRGKNNLQRFSWEATAAETLKVYRKVLRDRLQKTSPARA